MAPETLAAPFTEATVPYSTVDFPFADAVLALFKDAFKDVGDGPLERVHEHVGRNQVSVRRRLETKALKKLRGFAAFEALYFRFVREVLRPHLGEDVVACEREPYLRVHLSGGKAAVAPHVDRDHFHSPYEVNFWLPLVDVSGAESLWSESSPGRGDFRPFVAKYGEAVRFYGNQCQHFTVDNETPRTRVSFDFRVIRGRDLDAAKLPEGGRRQRRGRSASGVHHTLFGYYGLHDRQRELDREQWRARREAGLGRPSDAEDVGAGDVPAAAAVGVLPAGAPEVDDRPRTPSPEHMRRCAEELGSERAALRRCARCSWLANRRELAPRLRYWDSAGRESSWVAEHKGGQWGLGCIPCAEAARRGLIPRDALSEFSFGRAVGGRRQPLLVSALVRHGNHALGQGLDGRQVRQVLRHNDSHSEALKYLGATDVPPLRDAT